MGSNSRSMLFSINLNGRKGQPKLILEAAIAVKEGDVVAIKHRRKIKLLKLNAALLQEISTGKAMHLIGKLYALETELPADECTVIGLYAPSTIFL